MYDDNLVHLSYQKLSAGGGWYHVMLLVSEKLSTISQENH